MRPFRIVLVFTLPSLFAPGQGLPGQEIDYDREEVADGVHFFTSNDPGLGNVVAVVSGEEALVIDATATPAAAEEVVEALRNLGVVRVVALINTHWHDDHIWGNQTIVDAFPGVEVFAHGETVKGIRERAIPALSDQIARLHQRIGERARQLETGAKEDGTPLSAEERIQLQERQALFRDAVVSLETVVPVIPTVLAGDSWVFSVGDIQPHVQYLGGGHTPGDLVVNVPSKGVVIAGDLLTQPVPAAAEADLVSWVVVLESLQSMEWQVLLPGHGGAQYDKTYLSAVLGLFRSVIEYVETGIHEGKSLEEMIEAAEFREFRDRWLGGDPRSEAMFEAFFLEPGIRSTFSAISSSL